MKTARMMAVVVTCMGWSPSAGWAQTGQATSGSLQGQNTIQQAPSGGRVGGGATATGSAVGNGQPTAEERRTEEHNKAVTQICKGC